MVPQERPPSSRSIAAVLSHLLTCLLTQLCPQTVVDMAGLVSVLCAGMREFLHLPYVCVLCVVRGLALGVCERGGRCTIYSGRGASPPPARLETLKQALLPTGAPLFAVWEPRRLVGAGVLTVTVCEWLWRLLQCCCSRAARKACLTVRWCLLRAVSEAWPMGCRTAKHGRTAAWLRACGLVEVVEPGRSGVCRSAPQ